MSNTIISRTQALRGVVAAKLATLPGATYYRQADDQAVFPYKVYSLPRTTAVEGKRGDYEVQIDLWDKGLDPKAIEALADDVETLFDVSNDPQSSVLPTFFLEYRLPMDDPDKELLHIRVVVSCQNYAR